MSGFGDSWARAACQPPPGVQVTLIGMVGLENHPPDPGSGGSAGLTRRGPGPASSCSNPSPHQGAECLVQRHGLHTAWSSSS